MKSHAASAFRHVRRFLRVGEAVSALEYAILVGVIAVAVAAALVTFGGNITTAMNKIGSQVVEGGKTAQKASLK